MRLDEKLKDKQFAYKGTRKEYKIHDPRPDVFILDSNYKDDSILGWNLNYYDGDKGKLRSRVNKAIKEIKFYKRAKKLKRYHLIKEQFPFMSKFIRRYKKVGIEKIGESNEIRQYYK